MSRVHLVTQAYGSADVRAQALYAAWSALAFADGVSLSVHVYTDDAASFAPLAGKVSLRMLSRNEIRAWRGPHDFVHRVKPELIREMAARFPGEKLLYVDADAFFTGPVALAFERIGPGRVVMHKREYCVATHATSQMRKFRRHMGALAFRGAPIDLSPDMWNAGALGLDPAQLGVVPEWLEFIDEIYPRYRRGLVEQFAVSALLQRQAVVSPVNDILFHYWFQKIDHLVEIRRALGILLARSFPDSLAHLRANTIRIPYRREHSRLSVRMRRIWTDLRSYAIR